MTAFDPPTLGDGKICYLEIPARDVERSAGFYARAFGWKLRRRGDGAVAFDDPVNEVSGTWVTDRPPTSELGLTIHIMVADADAAAAAVLAAGGEIVAPVSDATGDRLARFRDPGGNVLGIYQQPGLAGLQPVPEHLHTVSPRLLVADAAVAIDFYVAAFAAEEVGERFAMPDGSVPHAELRIGDSIVMLSETGESATAGLRSLLSTFWPDVDAVWQRALAAGATVAYPLDDKFYGDRSGRLRDPFGHEWVLAQRIEDLTNEQMLKRASASPA